MQGHPDEIEEIRNHFKGIVEVSGHQSKVKCPALRSEQYCSLSVIIQIPPGKSITGALYASAFQLKLFLEFVDPVNFKRSNGGHEAGSTSLRGGVIWRMNHLSEWHVFNPADRNTYPKVTYLTQVRDASGATEEGDFLKLVSLARRGLKPMITGWRYIRDKRIK
jgi:hypothetical protein